VTAATETILSEQALASEAAQQLLAGQKAAAVELRTLQASQAEAFAEAEASLSSLEGKQSEVRSRK